MAWLWLPLILLAQAGARPEGAQAQAPQAHRGARLAWARGPGAEGCVGPAALAEDVKARLGWDPFALRPELEVEGTIAREGDALRADLWMRDASGRSLGRRTLRTRARDCRSLGEAVATAISVAIDPDVTGERRAEPEDVSDAPAAAEAPAPPPPRAPEEPADRVRIGVTGGVTTGMVPGPSDVYTLRASLLFGARVELGAAMAYFRESTEGDFAFAMTTGALEACVDPWGPRGAVRFCGAALVGAFSATVRSGDRRPADVGAHAWAGLEAGPVLSLGLTRHARLELGTRALVPVVRRQGFVRGADAPVWEQSALGGRLDLGVAAIF